MPGEWADGSRQCQSRPWCQAMEHTCAFGATQSEGTSSRVGQGQVVLGSRLQLHTCCLNPALPRLWVSLRGPHPTYCVTLEQLGSLLGGVTQATSWCFEAGWRTTCTCNHEEQGPSPQASVHAVGPPRPHQVPISVGPGTSPIPLGHTATSRCVPVL